MIIKNSVHDLLKTFRRENGIPIEVTEPMKVTLSNIERKTASVYKAHIYNQDINLIYSEGPSMRRALNVANKVRKNSSLEIVLFVAQLNKSDRALLLSESQPFITLEGETFLPFIGTRLFPNRNKMENDNYVLSPGGQRLFLFILMLMLLAEKDSKQFYETYGKSFRVTDTNVFVFKVGQEFYEDFGKDIEINNRLSFSRAANDLISHELLKASGETRNRIYTFPLGSKDYFQLGKSYLQSPVQKNELRFSSLDNTEIMNTLNLSEYMKSGLTALSKVTMISDEGINVLVTSKKMISTIPESINKTSQNKKYRLFNYGTEFEIQTQRYDLNFFNVLYRRVDKNYPSNVVDPFNLYLMFLGQNNDIRVTDELETMLDNIWRN